MKSRNWIIGIGLLVIGAGIGANAVWWLRTPAAAAGAEWEAVRWTGDGGEDRCGTAEAAAAGTTRRTPGGRPQGLLLGGGPSIIAQRRQGVLVHGHLSELLEGRLI